jgi:hypothetical protein
MDPLWTHYGPGMTQYGPPMDPQQADNVRLQLLLEKRFFMFSLQPTVLAIDYKFSRKVAGEPS